MIYIASLFALFIFSLSKQHNNELFFLGVVIILFQSCFRASSIGIDTSAGYLTIFQYVQNNVGTAWIEPGWTLINRFVVMIGGGYEGVLIIAGVLTTIPVAYVIYHNCENRCLGLAIYYGMYFVLFSFNLMRQCVAISFVLLAVHFYNSNRLIKAGAMLVIAFMFHKSAVLILVLLVLKYITFSYKSIVGLMIGSMAIGLLINETVLSIIAGKYAHYLTSSDGYNGFRSDYIIPFALSLMVTTFFLVVFASDCNKWKDNLWFKMVICGLAIMNASFQLGQGTRLVLYFSQAQIVFMPCYFDSIRNRDNRCFIISFYILYLFANFFRMLIAQWDTVTPYMTFWQAPV